MTKRGKIKQRTKTGGRKKGTKNKTTPETIIIHDLNEIRHTIYRNLKERATDPASPIVNAIAANNLIARNIKYFSFNEKTERKKPDMNDDAAFYIIEGGRFIKSEPVNIGNDEELCMLDEIFDKINEENLTDRS